MKVLISALIIGFSIFASYIFIIVLIFVGRFYLDRKIVDTQERCAQIRVTLDANKNLETTTPENAQFEKEYEQCLTPSTEKNLLSIATSPYIMILLPFILGGVTGVAIARKVNP